jgi:hypothetical protein
MEIAPDERSSLDDIGQFHYLLMELHKDLLSYQGEMASQNKGKILTSFELWDLSIRDQEFQWLRRLSEIIVIIDEAREVTQVSEHFLPWLRKEIDELFFKNMDSEFRTRLQTALEKRSDLYFLVGRMRRLL